MNYELAKELKDAGFPFKVLRLGDDMGKDWVEVDGEQYVAPTLSELIDACGDRFGRLSRHKNGTWRAEESIHTDTHFVLKKLEDAKIPEIAAARLWLALNKK